jgi:hypothetical protein
MELDLIEINLKDAATRNVLDGATVDQVMDRARRPEAGLVDARETSRQYRRVAERFPNPRSARPAQHSYVDAGGRE